MKIYYILLILNLSLLQFSTLTGQNMAYYTDLSETINGEKYMSIYSFQATYISNNRLKNMETKDVEDLLESLGIESKYSTIKVDNEAILYEDDPSPRELFPLSALMNINGDLILANLKIEGEKQVLRLTDKGEVFINEIHIANISKDYKVLDLNNEIIAHIINDDFFGLYDDHKVSLMNHKFETLVTIEQNGKFKLNKTHFEWSPSGDLLIDGAKSKVKNNGLKRQLFQTTSVLYYLFFENKIINLEEQFKENVYKLIAEKVRLNYNLKMRNDLWEEKKVQKMSYNFGLAFEQVLNNETKKINTQKTIVKNSLEGDSELYDSISALDISIPGYYKKHLSKVILKNLDLTIFQVKNINVNITKGKLKKSFGNEAVDKAVVDKIQLDGMYNISFNYAFLNGKQIVNAIYYTKTSVLNPKKSIGNKGFKLDLDSRGNPYKRENPPLDIEIDSK